MSDTQQVFREWLDTVEELGDPRRADVTAVTARVVAHTLAGIDGLCEVLGASRSKVATRLIEASLYHALAGVGLMLTTDEEGDWMTVPIEVGPPAFRVEDVKGPRARPDGVVEP